MNKNKNWYLTDNNFEKLTFEQAKDLYILYLNEVDIEKKKQLRTKIIEGTLYMVLEFIQNNQFDLLHSSNYDMDDIINTAFEIWIRKIDEGMLLKTKFLSQIFYREFYYDMRQILVNDEYSITSCLNMDQPTFVELLTEFICKKKQNDSFNYPMFISWIKEDSKYQYLLEKGSTMLANEYILLDGIYQSFQNNEVHMAKTRIGWSIDLLIQNGLEYIRDNIYNIKVDCFEDELLNKELNHNFLDVVLNQCRLSEIEKEVLKRRFGIDRERQTLEEVGKEYNRSRDRISRIEAKAIRKLKINREKLSHFND